MFGIHYLLYCQLEILSAYVICCKFSPKQQINFNLNANSIDTDQTALGPPFVLWRKPKYNKADNKASS